MESVPFYSSTRQNYARNFKRSTFSSTPCENLAPINYQYGILQTPPFVHQSFPPFLAHTQPPLLPLPISNGAQTYNHFHNLSQSRGLSCPPISRKVNKNGKKYSKSSTTSPKKEETPKSSKVKETNVSSDKALVMVSSAKHLGPDPKHLPKDASMVLCLSPKVEKEQSGALSFPSKKDLFMDLEHSGAPNPEDLSFSSSGEKELSNALSSQFDRSSRKVLGHSSVVNISHIKKDVPKALFTGKGQSNARSFSSLDSLEREVMVLPKLSTGGKKQFGTQSIRFVQEKDGRTLNQLNGDIFKGSVEDKFNNFSGSVVFTISPSPSSLPLPTFSLRPKLSCKTEAAAGIDAGATDNLRRLLRL